MTFRVKIRKEVIKELKKMPKAHLNRFLELKEVPQYEAVPRDRFDIAKLKGSDDLDIYRVRLGEYRVIYSVNWEERVILIHRLKRRGEAYK